MTNLEEFDFIFTVACLDDDINICPPTGSALDNFETNGIPKVKKQLSQPNEPDRLILKDLKIYKGPEGHPYQRSIFTGLARGKIFSLDQCGKLDLTMEAGGVLFNAFLEKVFEELDPDGIEWATWTVTPLPDGVFNQFDFINKGGSGKG